MPSDEETARVERLNRLCGEIDALQRESRTISDVADLAVHRANHEAYMKAAERGQESRAKRVSEPEEK